MKEKRVASSSRGGETDCRGNNITDGNDNRASTKGTSSNPQQNPKRRPWQMVTLPLTLVFLIEYYWVGPLLRPEVDKTTLTKRDTANQQFIASSTSQSPRRANIFLARTGKPFKNMEYAYSLFLMNASTWKRFGSHRLELDVQWIDQLPNLTKAKKKKNKNLSGHLFDLSSFDTWQPSAPCLLVGKFTNQLLALQNETHILKDCKRIVSYDEFCRQATEEVIHVRHYYSSQMPVEALYLPLGPRVDFVQAAALSSTQKWPDFDQRTYWMNALFSESPSPIRRVLKDILEHDLDESIRNDLKIQIAPKWSAVLGADHLAPIDYVEILSQSKFTLVPVGHNPESFRLWETLERGSIPIVARQATDASGIHGPSVPSA